MIKLKFYSDFATLEVQGKQVSICTHPDQFNQITDKAHLLAAAYDESVCIIRAAGTWETESQQNSC